MRQPRRALVLLAALLVSACATASDRSRSVTSGPRAERPTYSIGDRWIRSDGAYDLVRIEDDLYVFAASNGNEVHLTRDLTLAYTVWRGQPDFEFFPPPKISWPLEVGKSGYASLTWRDNREPSVGQGFNLGSGMQASLAWRVEAYEEVFTPAGAFKAFRVAFSFVTMNPSTSGFSWELRLWYAPEIRQIVLISGSRNLRRLNARVVVVDRPAEPLMVALHGLKDQAHVAAPGLQVSGTVTAGELVKQVTATLNGEEIRRLEERELGKKEVSLDFPMKLREGKNVLIVTAVASQGGTVQEVRTLFYEKPSTVLSAPPVSPPPAPSLPPVVAKPPPPPAGPAPLPTAPPVVAALPPLRFAFSSPRDQARVEQETIGLAGLVSSGIGVSRVVVALNGIEVSRFEERTPQPAMAINLPIKLREGQNTLVLTAAEAGGTLYQDARTIQYDRPVPLTVAVRYPEDQARATDDSSLVAAIVTSSKGVASVRVTLNGAEVYQQSERAPQKSLVVTAPVTLREGPNAIVLTAAEPDGTVRQEVLTVFYDRPPVPVAASAPPPQRKPARDRWAVVIGVGRYESPDIPKLRYSVPDAEAVSDVLTGLGGFKKEHVLLLTDKTERKPTYRNLKWALGTFLARSAKKEDTVVIYFAGHGAPEVDQRGVERDGFSKYLVPADAEPEDLYSTALPMDELPTIFSRLEAERVIVFLDACYSGAAGGRTFASKKTRASHVDEQFLERLAASRGRAILTASRPAEVSLELPELGHGIFTYYLVQGLKGAADLNKDGIVTVQELYEYVEQQVSVKSRSVGGNQHPVMKGEMEGALPLVKVR